VWLARATARNLVTMMTWREPLFCVLASAWALTALGAQNRPAQSDQEILIQIERDWDAAFLRKDLQFIDNILAADFRVTYPDGSRGDKTKELSLAAEFDQQIDSSRVDEFAVMVNGDTAVVWFTRHLVGPSQGRRIELTQRYLDVFMWRGGRWQCVASQSTKVNVP
jgi:ketosteroid isomerase-like protein